MKFTHANKINDLNGVETNFQLECNVDSGNQILEDLEKKGKKFKKIHRSKGLGENTPDMLWDTTMNPKTRRLVKLDIDANNEYVRAMSNMLFGNDVNNDRKDYIFNMLSQGILDLEVEKSVVSD